MVFKKAFTLFELIIVVILISIIYYFALSNLNLKQNKLDMVTLMNLKQTLNGFEFNDEIALKCIDSMQDLEYLECLVIIDGEIQKEKIEQLFKGCPQSYEYSREQKLLEFSDIKLDEFSNSLDICFEFIVNKNGDSSQMVVDMNDEVFIFDNISQKPHKIKYINDLEIYFDNKDSKVKDAF